MGLTYVFTLSYPIIFLLKNKTKILIKRKKYFQYNITLRMEL